ncbi:hypothetical protein M1L60_10785 [Actinoplanes sp. TRM 88003]|uniref:Uncharacterized protein n=1 Tax=Paractinoplanes aksuensis TaxID=2939490 RepID=A0ABT1DKP8_9ACTN|nr:hypothetical protein [Actinoplanes aksuensis]MCO8271078.1 hypothetical protein [Actinoplanes aksuensis]
MTRTELPVELLDADPIQTVAPNEVARLTALRIDVDARRHATAFSQKARPRRRLLAFGGLAVGVVATSLVAAVPVPALWPWDNGSAPFIDAAIAADGSLQCGNGGSAQPIRPDRSDLRLWPTKLPEGWKVVKIAATSNSSISGCFTRRWWSRRWPATAW